jgi:hypothetical protein
VKQGQHVFVIALGGALYSLSASDPFCFALRRLKVKMVSVSRWETIRSPSGLSLVRLAKYARDVGLEDLAVIFDEELGRTRAIWDISQFSLAESALATLARLLTEEFIDKNEESIDVPFLKEYIKLLRQSLRVCARGIEKAENGPAELERKWILTQRRLKRALEDAENKAAQER